MKYAVLAALRQPGAWAVFTVIVLAGVVGGPWLARRRGWRVAATVGAFLTAAPAAALTLVPTMSFPLSGSWSRWLGFATEFIDADRVRGAVAGVVSGPDQVGNVLVYVPAVFLAAVACRRYGAVLGAGVAASVLTESWQAVSGSRAADVADVASNTLGVVLAVAVAIGCERFVKAVRSARIAGSRSAEVGGSVCGDAGNVPVEQTSP